VRPPLSHRPRGARFPFLTFALVLAVLAVVATVAPPAGATSAPPSTLALVGEAPNVVTSESGLTLQVSVRSPLAASQLGIDVTLFSKAQYLDTFRQTLSGDTAGLGVMSGTGGALPLSAFERQASGGVFSIRLPVSAPDLPGSTGKAPKRGAVLQVTCAPGGCAGVYPLQVSLTNLDEGITLDTFTTYLVLAPPSETSGTSRLRFAWVMPLGSQPAVTARGTGAPSATELSEVSQLASVFGPGSIVPINLELVPQFVEGLTLARRTGADALALSSLQNLVSSSTVETIPGTFSAVNVAALTDSGLSGDVATQLAQGRRVLTSELHVAGRVAEFAANAPMGDRTLALLAAEGINAVVLPPEAVTAATPDEQVYAALSPFLVSHSGVEAVASDAGLEADLTGLTGPGGSVLRANQLLANLAELYFQVPNARKGVVLLPPTTWRPTLSFLQTVAGGLAFNPLVQASTLSSLFASVPPGASSPDPGVLRTRALAPGQVPAAGLLPGGQIRQAEQRLSAVSSSMPSATAVLQRLTDSVLMAETARLPQDSRNAYLGAVSRVLRRIGGLISLPFGHTITLTSLNAKVPISILSRASVPVMVELAVTSPDLGFGRQRIWHVRLLPRTNIVTLDLSARTSGDFPLDLDVLSADGAYVLTSGRMTIRSTAISGVAVGISVGALAFLVLWWSRSILKRRRQRRQAAADGTVTGQEGGGTGGLRRWSRPTPAGGTGAQ